MLVGLVLGSMAAEASPRWSVSLWVGGLHFPLQGLAAGARTIGPPELGTSAIALLQPVGAWVAYTLATALSFLYDDPRGHQEAAAGRQFTPTGTRNCSSGTGIARRELKMWVSREMIRRTSCRRRTLERSSSRL